MATNFLQSTISAAIWALVRQQHGVISRAQLLDFGLTPSAIANRIRTARLHRVYDGVYAVGRRELTRQGEWMAAVLSCGPFAFLSHFSAAALWRIRLWEPRGIEVSVPATVTRKRPGLVIHRRAALQPVMHERIPVTDVVTTLIDIAPHLTRNEFEAAIREADKRDYIDPEQLREALDDLSPRPGIRTARRTLDRRTFRLTDSELERLFLPISDRAGLPRPLTQQVIDGERVDFHYPDLKLVIETDGLRYHRTPSQQAKDLVRDHKHFAAELVPLRFTHEQIKYEPAYVEATLRQVGQRLAD